MKALTVKQPWASLIANGIKEYEFRTWKTKHRGELIIHAGKGEDKKAYAKYEKYNLIYPKGCVVAKVQLVDCILIDEEFRKYLYELNPIVYKSAGDKSFEGHYAWKIENVEKINSDKIINGKLSFWEIKEGSY